MAAKNAVCEFLALCAREGWAETILALELEAGGSLCEGLPEGLRFVRQLVLGGRWAALRRMLQTTMGDSGAGHAHGVPAHGGNTGSNAVGGNGVSAGKGGGAQHSELHKEAMLTALRQQYLELLAFDPATSTHPHDQLSSKDPIEKPLAAIMGCLSAIQGLAAAQEYHALCSLLSLRNVTDHPNYSSWSRGKGRLAVWDAILPLLYASPALTRAAAATGAATMAIAATSEQQDASRGAAALPMEQSEGPPTHATHGVPGAAAGAQRPPSAPSLAPSTAPHDGPVLTAAPAAASALPQQPAAAASNQLNEPARQPGQQPVEAPRPRLSARQSIMAW